jgi:hypothetical protein
VTYEFRGKISPATSIRDTCGSIACDAVRRSNESWAIEFGAGRQRGLFQGATRFNPVGEAAAVITYVGVTKLGEQRDRLLALWSSKFPAVNYNFGMPIGQKVRSAAFKVL